MCEPPLLDKPSVNGSQYPGWEHPSADMEVFCTQYRETSAHLEII